MWHQTRFWLFDRLPVSWVIWFATAVPALAIAGDGLLLLCGRDGFISRAIVNCGRAWLLFYRKRTAIVGPVRFITFQ
jgi:hypothetical protein